MVLSLAGSAQTTTTTTTGTTTVSNGSNNMTQGPNRWWWGVNMGATWQTSDMKTIPGFGWGITATKLSRYKDDRILFWGGRFRFLDGRNYGEDFTRFRGLQNNTVLNGSGTTPTSSELNYYQNGSGFLFRNYKMNLDELSFELMVGPNAPRKYGVLMYLWGGAGFAYTQTKIDQLDASGVKYDYSTIDTTQSKSMIRTQLEGMWDGTYETVAQGSSNPTWKFMPSAGIGIGKQFGQGFMIGLEHKITFTMDKVIDGNLYSSNTLADPKNDWYHYTGFYIKWRFNSRSTAHADPPPHNTTYTDPNTYTNPTHPPVVIIDNPTSNPYYTYSPSAQIMATVRNVTTRNQVTLTINGMPSTNFAFTPGTGQSQITINTVLNPGTNTYYITGTNADGTDSKTQTIILQQNTTVVTTTPQYPPQVTITNPPSNPYTSPVQNMTINSTVINVNSANDIVVHRNGQTITGWTYNPTSKNLVLPVTLQTGSNLFDVVATNAVGSDAASVTIYYGSTTTVVTAPPPPDVTITNPPTTPYTSTTQNMTLTATVINVNSQSEITVHRNSQTITGWTYNMTTKNLTFPVTLQPGANLFDVVASNANGSDAASVVINYSTPVVTNPPPVVTITNPAVCPGQSKIPTYTFMATVINVTSQSGITVNFNGTNLSSNGFAFNPTTGVVTVPVALHPGMNNITVTGTNSVGSNSKSCSVELKVTTPPPTVTITNPASSPFTTTNPAFTLNATVLNVNSQNEITVTRNNTTVSGWTYNMSSHALVLPTTLTDLSTTFVVAASNANGSDSKSQIVIWRNTSTTNTNTTTPCDAPVVHFHQPTDNPHIQSSNVANITALIDNVSSASEITVKRQLTMTPVPFNFNPTTHMVTVTDNITPGATPYVITATNSCGTDSKSVTIKLVQSNGSTTTGSTGGSSGGSSATTGGTQGHQSTTTGGSGPIVGNGGTGGSGPIVGNGGTGSVGSTGTSSGTQTGGNTGGGTHTGQPVITLQTPTTTTYSTTNTSLAVTVNIQNISGVGDVAVRVNNIRLMSGVSYNNGTVTFTANMNVGNNTIEIQAQNPSGMDSKTITVTVASPRMGSGGGRSSGGKTSTTTSGTGKSSTSTSTSTTTGGSSTSGRSTSSGSGSSTTTSGDKGKDTPKTGDTPKSTSAGRGGE